MLALQFFRHDNACEVSESPERLAASKKHLTEIPANTDFSQVPKSGAEVTQSDRSSKDTQPPK